MATKSIAWNTGSGNITLTYSGQGDGPITVQSDANNGSARSQVITVETVGGAITRNFTVSQAACPFPVGNVKNFSYTGSYQEIELPAGQYKLQCWGAQGGSNGTNSTYGITAKAGGKGGYSEGIITLSTKTTVRVYVGGQGSSSAGGFNGGGSTSGTSQYDASSEFGYSKMGGGGGATDIRLSDGALLSRMIVAGGGSGGAMCYKRKTTTVTTTITDASSSSINTTYSHQNQNNGIWVSHLIDNIPITPSVSYTVSGIPWETGTLGWFIRFTKSANPEDTNRTQTAYSSGTSATVTAPSGYSYVHVWVNKSRDYGYVSGSFTAKITHTETTSSTTTNNYSQVGFVGGGTNGGGYSTTYQGKQASAGSGGAFGTGANQSTTGYRYCSGAGGGGWYGGGGGQKSDSSYSYVYYSGGGSGFVNTAASAGNRPSGYTGLQLDSGETKDGSTSFPNTAGTGNETGHSGNGYAKITRLA